MKVDYTLVTPFFIETVNSASVAQLKQLSENLGISEVDKTGTKFNDAGKEGFGSLG